MRNCTKGKHQTGVACLQDTLRINETFATKSRSISVRINLKVKKLDTGLVSFYMEKSYDLSIGGGDVGNIYRTGKLNSERKEILHIPFFLSFFLSF